MLLLKAFVTYLLMVTGVDVKAVFDGFVTENKLSFKETRDLRDALNEQLNVSVSAAPKQDAPVVVEPQDKEPADV